MPEATLEFSAAGLTAADLVGFFVGWPSPPAPAERLDILRAADEVIVARDADWRNDERLGASGAAIS